MNRYIVTEEELVNVHRLLEEYHCGLIDRRAVEEAQVACRQQIVPEWAKYFTGEIEFGLDYGLMDIKEWETIK